MGKYRDQYQSSKGIEEIGQFLQAQGLGLIAFNRQGEDVFTSKKTGIRPLYDLYQAQIQEDLILWDRVIGAGAAFFINHLPIVKVRTPLISASALERLDPSLDLAYGAKVDRILNRQQDDLCPIEKLAQGSHNFSEFIGRLEDFFQGR